MDKASARLRSVRHLTPILATLPLAACAQAFAGNASGTYVGKTSNEAVLLQLVQTDGGQLTGRFEAVSLQAGGRLDDKTASVVGAVNGETITLTLKPAGFLEPSVPVSGTLRWGHLQLSASTSQAGELQRADEASFRAQVAQLTQQGAKVAAEEARREAAQRQAQFEAAQLGKLQNLTTRMADFNSKADAMLPKFPTVERSYRDFTARMRGGLGREQAIVGQGQAAVARSQLSIAINQVSIQADQTHFGVQTAMQMTGSTAGQLLREAAAFEQSCRVQAQPPQTTPTEKGLVSACADFAVVNRSFHDRVEALKNAFGEVEGVWSSEHSDQQAILQAANRAVG